MNKIVVIGCGASGMMAAIAAARSGADVTVLESGKKPGRKLLLTGNSRCNLTNTKIDPISDYHSDDESAKSRLVDAVFRKLDAEAARELFLEFGLLTRTEHGTYVYPSTGQSSSVLDVLLGELKRLKVKLKFQEDVKTIERNHASGFRWIVRTAGWQYPCDCVIICCGSRAVPSTGSDGRGYELCHMLGLDVTDIMPALTAVGCELPAEDITAYRPGGAKKNHDQNLFLTASGCRTQAIVSVFADDQLIASDEGQIQFTQHGISGIVVFNISRFAADAVRKRQYTEIRINLLPELSCMQIENLLKTLSAARPDDQPKELLAGILPDRLIPLVLHCAEQKAGSGENMSAAAGCGINGCVTKQDKQRFDPAAAAEVIHSLRLRAVSLRDFNNCQVCAGGVMLSQVEPETMECNLKGLDGIYLAGEILDIDGPCGGYNLQWAWSSGFAAGTSAASQIV